MQSGSKGRKGVATMKSPLTAWLIRITLMLMLLASILPKAMAQTPTAPATYTLDQVLSKMDQVGKDFKSLEAVIERTKVTVLVNDKSTDKGKIYVTREGNANRMKIDFTVPSPQSVLVDKGKVLLY